MSLSLVRAWIWGYLVYGVGMWRKERGWMDEGGEGGVSVVVAVEGQEWWFVV